MALTEAFLEDEIHPIDIVEDLAEHHEWEFDRIEENQIAMVVQGQWRTYSITLAWSDFDETLRLICSFEISITHLFVNQLIDPFQGPKGSPLGSKGPGPRLLKGPGGLLKRARAQALKRARGALKRARAQALKRAQGGP